ncbi:MAG: mechanosensitive ion channel domain-containing protein [Myxococcota bacterium]
MRPSTSITAAMLLAWMTIAVGCGDKDVSKAPSPDTGPSATPDIPLVKDFNFEAIPDLFVGSEVVVELVAISIIVLVTWLLSQALEWFIARARSLGNKRRRMFLSRYGPMFRLICWGLGLGAAVLVLFEASPIVIAFLALPVILGVGLAIQDLARNLIAGVIMSVDREFEEGDVLRVGEHEGEVLSIGLRNIKLEAFDGHVVEIPNAHFLNQTSSNITPETTDARVRIVMVLPAGVDLERARHAAYTAAVVSRYASLRTAAEVFVDTDGAEDLMTRLTIRGHVFDPTFEEHYRSDVVALVRKGLGLAKVSTTPELPPVPLPTQPAPKATGKAPGSTD